MMAAPFAPTNLPSDPSEAFAAASAQAFDYLKEHDPGHIALLKICDLHELRHLFNAYKSMITNGADKKNAQLAERSMAYFFTTAAEHNRLVTFLAEATGDLSYFGKLVS